MIKCNNKKIEKTVLEELLKVDIKTEKDLMHWKRKIARKNNIKIFSNSEILKAYKEETEKGLSRKIEFEKLLRKRAVRTMSGIAPVAILTKPFACPGQCAFCPTEKNVPQSYLSNEPAVMRAIRCEYNPYVQVQDRLRALIANGHEPTKIELIVIGGTWSVLPEKYKYWYILNAFKAANDFFKLSRIKKNQNNSHKISKLQFPISKQFSILKSQLAKEQKKNEKAKYKIVGVTLETRPDYISEKELWQMRELGATRVELGVQAIDNKILKINKRGHGVEEIARATGLLKTFGFKVTYHMMPGLPGSSPLKDEKMYKQLFNDERFQPDQIKFYPTVVTKGSLLYRWWKQGKYKPYSDKALLKLIVNCKAATPKYVRIIRLIRDIPGESIEAGNLVTNLRQIVKDSGVKCNCIRCREVKNQKFEKKDIKLNIIKYRASEGDEYFISYESSDGLMLYGFCRLRLSEESAIVRELHVYGELVSAGEKGIVQHTGLGKMLMDEAEKIAKEKKIKNISVISGVGVRDYYRKMKYKLKNTYMVKKLDN